MSSSISTMSLQKPSFKSNLPDYLLQDASPKERYILENLNVISQTHTWLVDETVKQSGKLESIESQTTKTNGRVTKLEEKNTIDKESDEEIKKIVAIKLFIEKYLFNKYALAAFFLLSVGMIKVLLNEQLREIFFKIIGLG